jgi:hypothetical protein
LGRDGTVISVLLEAGEDRVDVLISKLWTNLLTGKPLAPLGDSDGDAVKYDDSGFSLLIGKAGGASIISSISDSSRMVLLKLETGVVGIGEETEEAQSLELEDRLAALAPAEGVLERWKELDEPVDDVLLSRLGGVKTGRVGIWK